MWWVIIGAAVLVVAGVWLLAPTLRTFFGHDFEPAPKDDESVFLAQTHNMVDGGQ